MFLVFVSLISWSNEGYLLSSVVLYSSDSINFMNLCIKYIITLARIIEAYRGDIHGHKQSNGKVDIMIDLDLAWNISSFQLESPSKTSKVQFGR